MTLQIFGGLNEKEFLTGVDYVETENSGLTGIRTSNDSSAYGAMRTYEVKVEILCFKRDSDSVIAAFPAKPSALSTVGGSNNDGTLADRVQWGTGYELKTVSPSSFSPSMMKLVATYRKTVSDAQDAWPPSLTVSCSAGVYTVKWNGVAVQDWDNGTGSCGTTGVEFIKLPQIIKTYVVIRSVDGTLYQRTEDRYENRLDIRVDGASIVVFTTRARTVVTTGEVAISSGSAGETLTATLEGGTDYTADLRWEEDGTNYIQLLWNSLPSLKWEPA